MLKAVRTMLIVLVNIIFYALVVFGGVQLCQMGYAFAYDVFGETSVALPPGEEKSFTVRSGQDDFLLAQNLEEEGLIKNAYSFYVRVQLEKEKGAIGQPGVYTLNTNMTYEEIINMIWKI